MFGGFIRGFLVSQPAQVSRGLLGLVLSTLWTATCQWFAIPCRESSGMSAQPPTCLVMAKVDRKLWQLPQVLAHGKVLEIRL